jgi:hypothetical protein
LWGLVDLRWRLILRFPPGQKEGDQHNMLKRWPDILTVSCLVVCAVVEAGQQALKDAPKVSALFPSFVSGGWWNYIPFSFLIGAGASWLVGRFSKPVPPRSSVNWQNPHFDIVTGHRYVNKSIDVDGKSFRDCSFEHVTFTFRGTAPTEFVGNNKFSGGLSFDTDNPAIMLFTKLQRIFRSIPGARIEEGALDAKGNLLKDKFDVVEVKPEILPAVPGARDELTDLDPRIYLLDIKESGDAMFPKSLFVIKNDGGSVAHKVQIETLTFGYKIVSFPVTDSLGVGKIADVAPVIKDADLNNNWIVPVLTEAWNEAGIDKGEDFLKFPFTVRISCESFNGKRKIRSTIELTFCYLHHKWNIEGKTHHKVFETKKTTFELLKGDS